MRGEHSRAIFAAARHPGSSPHARGALWYQPLPGVSPGIIPACAGSTGTVAVSGSQCRDHPRMRGEHCARHRDRAYRGGSSPHARGALMDGKVPNAIIGIIPACAGSTHAPSSPPLATRDHPRMRGEHLRPDRERGCRAGSSPHARGARPYGIPARRPGGIIPACAGSTYHTLSIARGGRDHPRMRGEHT